MMAPVVESSGSNNSTFAPLAMSAWASVYCVVSLP